MKATPLQTVKKNFGSRADLVAKLSEMVDKQHGDESADQVKSRLSGLSNKKLLRLYQVEQKVRERFGDREKMIAHLVEARAKAGLTADDKYKVTLGTHSKARLLDMTRQKFGERPAKQSPEQRLNSKRGKKQRERAQAKIG